MEITNKTLAMFLVAAVVVSIAGTVISLNRLGSLQYTTGYASSDQGTATVYVNSTTDILFTIDSINWGEGYVNASVGAPLNCTLDSENTKSAGCIRFTQNNVGLILLNDGNTYPAVRLYSNVNGTDMFGAQTTYGGSQLQYKVTNNETNSCTSVPVSTYTDVNETNPGTLVCDALEYADANDTLRLDVWVNFNYLTASGQKTATFTATAS